MEFSSPSLQDPSLSKTTNFLPFSLFPLNWSFNWERAALITLVAIHILTSFALFSQGSVFLATCSFMGALLELKMSRDISNMLDLKKENQTLKIHNTTYAEQNIYYASLIDDLKKTYLNIATKFKEIGEGNEKQNQDSLKGLSAMSQKLASQLDALEDLKEKASATQKAFSEEVKSLAKKIFDADTERLSSMKMALSEVSMAAKEVAQAKQELSTLQKELEETRKALLKAKQDLEEVIAKTQKATHLNLASAEKIQEIYRKTSERAPENALSSHSILSGVFT